jgi:GTP pyrophosphokinase
MIRFEDLLGKVRAYSPDADVELLRRAYVFSAFEHRGQVRHSGEPYLIHPLAVADLLVDMKLDAVAIAAGLLHDVVEDTLTTIERIQELFGPEVAHVVEGVTKISAIPFSSSEERQAENFRKMLLASWRTGSTTCGRSITCQTTNASRSPRKRATSTRRLRTGSG